MRRAGIRRSCAAVAAFACLAVLIACGGASTDGGAADAPIDRSAATGAEAGSQHQIIREEDAGGDVIEVPFFFVDIGLPDKKGLEIFLTGDDASTLRWRFAQKPDPVFLEWYAVDGEFAFETDGLVGNPATAAKVLEFRGAGQGLPPSGSNTASRFRPSRRGAIRPPGARRAAPAARWWRSGR